MPPVRNMDGSSGDPDEGRWLPPPTVRVREPAQVQHRGEDSPWPFLYSYRQDGSATINRGTKKTNYQTAAEVGVANF